MTCLGAIATEYRINAYGEMSGPLHRGTPTDRLVAEWWIGRPHVERRRAARSGESGPRATPIRTAEVRDAVEAIETRDRDGWPVCHAVRPDADARRVLIAVPPRFTDLQQRDGTLALQWRLGVRDAFSAYFSRGYRAVDFFLDRQAEGGAYLLAREE
jgi:predicted GNAT superfamily acetyltransferase